MPMHFPILLCAAFAHLSHGTNAAWDPPLLLGSVAQLPLLVPHLHITHRTHLPKPQDVTVILGCEWGCGGCWEGARALGSIQPGTMARKSEHTLVNKHITHNNVSAPDDSMLIGKHPGCAVQ